MANKRPSFGRKTPNKTPEQTAEVERRNTENNRVAGSAITDFDRTFYSKKKYLKDKDSKDSTLDYKEDSEVVDRAEAKEVDCQRLGKMLIDYSMNTENITFSGFFRFTGIAPSVIFDLMSRNEGFRLQYELARVNLSYNNEKMLATKMNPILASKVSQFQSQFDPIRRADIREDKVFEERNKLEALKALVKERKELVSEDAESKVSYELIYDGHKVEL